MGCHLAQLVEQASHVQRLVLAAVAPGSSPVSLSLILFPVIS